MRKRFIVMLLLIIPRTALADVLPELTICADYSFNIESGGQSPYGMREKWGWASYTCKQDCKGDFTECSFPCPAESLGPGGSIMRRIMEGRAEDKSAGYDLSFTCVAFVVDQMGGLIRWTEDLGEPGPTLFGHMGGAGTGFYPVVFIGPLVEDGILVAEVRWEEGGFLDISTLKRKFPGGGGWFTRPDTGPASMQVLSRRPGAAILWVHDHLAAKDARYGTFGCSGGALATGAPMYWHSVDQDTPLIEVVDYQLLSGMAAYYDFADFCTRSRDNTGLCENDPDITCEDCLECGGHDDRCAFVELGWTTRHVIPIADLIDYMAVAGPDERCYQGKVPAGIEQSSMKYTQGFNDLGDTRVDFIVDEGSKALWFATDTFLGATGSVAHVYRVFTGGDKNWHDHHGYFHCASFAHPDLMPETISLIEKGLKVK